MSLQDALLLEPIQTEIWLALRTDGIAGSGREDDPLHAGVRNTPILSVDSIIVSGAFGSYLAEVTTTQDHGYKTGDLVIVRGVPCGTHTYDYLSNGKFLSGTFIVTVTTMRKFTYLLPAYNQNSELGYPQYSSVSPQIPDSIPSPAIAITCQLDPYLFDAIMRSLPASPPLCIRLGAGTFLTKGYSSLSKNVSWKPQSGMHLKGSGVAHTVLRLVEATLDHQVYQVIATSTSVAVDHFTIEDMTLDANVAGQVSKLLTCSAIFIQGNHTRFRQIRAINFGPQTLEWECFVISFAGGTPSIPGVKTPTDCVMEGCIVENPGLNPVRESTLLACIYNAGPVPPGTIPADPNSQFVGYHQSCVVRNCNVNCEFQLNPVSLDVSQIVVVTGSATIKSRTPHGLPIGVGKEVRISGAFDHQRI